MAKRESCRDAALQYAGMGFRVLPVQPGRKVPLFPNWPILATSDTHLIREWFQRWPRANVGIACGDGLGVLDIDPEAVSSGWPGRQKWEELHTLGPPMVRTPREGYHLYFRAEGWRNSAGVIAPGVDTFGAGGFMVAPPSVVHRKRYQWLKPLLPLEKLPSPPFWLQESLRRMSSLRDAWEKFIFDRPAQSTGVLDWPIAETPLCIVDLETTGLSPGVDRVVEIAVVRIDPGQLPRLVLDTLINPERPVTASEVHRITYKDVVDAPRFRDIAGHLVRAMYGCVLASYKIDFDLPFLQYELERLGFLATPPHLCLMYLRPMLGIGDWCSLNEACRAHRIRRRIRHVAAADALDSARLWEVYLRTMMERQIHTFRDLKDVAELRRSDWPVVKEAYKFVESFQHAPLWPPSGCYLPAEHHFKSRTGWQPLY